LGCFTQDGIDGLSAPRLLNKIEEFVKKEVEETSRFKANPGAPPCVWTQGVYNYLNFESVKTALHVNPNTEWIICNNEIGDVYQTPSQGSIPQYEQLLAANKYKLVVYSGDADGCVPSIDSEYWIKQFNLTIQNNWREWFVNDQVAGMVIDYAGLTYTTIKGAGHMAPAIKRQETYVMVESFLSGQPLPNATERAFIEI